MADFLIVLRMRCGEQADSEDDKLGWPKGGEADLDVDAAFVDVGLGHCGRVAFDEEGLLGLASLKCALLPEFGHEGVDGEANGGPQGRSVGFEDDPLEAG